MNSKTEIKVRRLPRFAHLPNLPSINFIDDLFSIKLKERYNNKNPVLERGFYCQLLLLAFTARQNPNKQLRSNIWSISQQRNRLRH